MNEKMGWIVAVVVAVVAVGYYFWPVISRAPGLAELGAPKQQEAADFGTYNYECDEHVAFSMTIAADVSSMQVAPASGGAYPPAGMLVKKPATSGVRYEGNGVVLTARGETVTLGEGDSAINCSPVSVPDEAPFNWGD